MNGRQGRVLNWQTRQRPRKATRIHPLRIAPFISFPRELHLPLPVSRNTELDLADGDGGSDPGVTSMMYYRPGEGTGFVFLMNAEPKGGRFEEALARRLLEFAQKQ